MVGGTYHTNVPLGCPSLLTRDICLSFLESLNPNVKGFSWTKKGECLRAKPISVQQPHLTPVCLGTTQCVDIEVIFVCCVLKLIFLFNKPLDCVAVMCKKCTIFPFHKER